MPFGAAVDCIEYVVTRPPPVKFWERLISWTQAVKREAEEVIAVDGKATRGSRYPAKWACENRLILAQEATAEKSNEINAIPKLLELLELKGCIVTLDAMGRQRAIAEQIKGQQGDYVMSLKGSQSDLHEAVEDYFTTA